MATGSRALEGSNLPRSAAATATVAAVGYDVTLTADPVESARMTITVPLQTIRYHVDRVWTGSTWTLDITPQPFAPTGILGSIGPGMDVGLVRTNDLSSVLTAATRSGTSLSNSQGPDYTALLNGQPIWRPAWPDTAPDFAPPPPPRFVLYSVAPQASASLAAATARAPAGVGRPATASARSVAGAPLPSLAAADSLSVSGAHGDLLIQVDSRGTRPNLLGPHVGTRAGAVNGKLRYLLQRNSDVYETLVDSATLIPVERNLAVAGALVQRVTYEYAPLTPTLYYRKRVVFQRVVDGSTQPRVIGDYQITSMRLNGREVP